MAKPNRSGCRPTSFLHPSGRIAEGTHSQSYREEGSRSVVLIACEVPVALVDSQFSVRVVGSVQVTCLIERRGLLCTEV